jgi:hypothetical protein
MPTFPSAVITNGVESGFELSSTSNALPLPVCVMRTALEDEFALNIADVPLTSPDAVKDVAEIAQVAATLSALIAPVVVNDWLPRSTEED